MEDCLFARNPDFIFRHILDEAVLVPVHRPVTDMRCLYTLNEVGAAVWEKLASPATQAELQSAILDEYEVSAEDAARDLGAFLAGMERIGSIRRIGSMGKV